MKILISVAIFAVAPWAMAKTGGVHDGQQQHSERLPPLGKRTYVLDSGKPYEPVEIRKSPEGSQQYLKDPLQPGERRPKRKSKRRTGPPRKRGPRHVPAKLAFKTLAVTGHLTKPRVEFSRDILPVGRVDEPIEADFYQKVFEPIDDVEF